MTKRGQLLGSSADNVKGQRGAQSNWTLNTTPGLAEGLVFDRCRITVKNVEQRVESSHLCEEGQSRKRLA